MLPRPSVLTEEGKAKLEAERAHLSTVRRRDVAERIHQAMDLSGDPVDNAEYQDAKDEQAFIEGRIRELDHILATATVISGEPIASGVVQVGSLVSVRDEEGEEDTFVLVGSTEADPFQGRYSLDSPIGSAVLGRRVGETVVVAAPAGALKYTILSSKPRS